MKKIIFFIGIILIVYACFVFYPKTINFYTQGLKYKLGAVSVGKEQLVNIHIQGKVYRDLTGNKTFKGIIEFDDDEIPVPEEYRQIDINFYKTNVGVIAYPYYYDAKAEIYTYGSIYINKDFNKVTIAVLEHDGNRGNWTGENGIMITAPASNRSDAINLSNELMKDYLNGYRLE